MILTYHFGQNRAYTARCDTCDEETWPPALDEYLAEIDALDAGMVSWQRVGGDRRHVCPGCLLARIERSEAFHLEVTSV